MNAVKDAAGRTPKALTRHERRWRDALESGDLRRRFDELRKRQALPLEAKIELTMERIREWVDAWEGAVSVSFSGGKDSAVLLWIARQVDPSIPAVFVNTGLEYPEVASLAKRTPNTAVVRPKIPFHHVIRDYGWPVVSKKVARGINVLRNPTKANQNIWRLYDQGVNRFGRPVNGFKVAERWRFLVDAPFPVSDRCCQIMKKDPMARYERETGRAAMVGMMAADSKAREKVYLQTGCNAFDAKHPRSMPMGFWTEADVLAALKRYGIPYPSVYGNIVEGPDGRLKFDGVHSTGCLFCVFGLHMEGQPNRFQRLRESHPHLFRFCMDRLGLGEVLAFIRSRCPDRNVRGLFTAEEYVPPLEQCALF